MSGAAENLVKCHHSYQAQQDDELTLSINDIVQVEEYHDDSWWLGKNLTTKKSGLFPSNFVMPLSTHCVSIPRDAERVQAAFDYEPQAPDELTLKKGDIVTVISKDDGWWSGEIAGKIGLFPANFVVPCNPPAAEKVTSYSKYNTAPAQTSNIEESSDPPKRTSFSDNFKLAAYGVKKGGIGSLFSGAKSLKGKPKPSTRNSQTFDAENISPIPSPRQSIASITEEMPDLASLNNSSSRPPTKLPGSNELSNPSSEALKDNHTSPQSKLPPIPSAKSLPSPPQANLPQPPTKIDNKLQSDMPPIPLPAIPDQTTSAPLHISSSSKSEVEKLNEDSQSTGSNEVKENIPMEQKSDDEKQSLEESENDAPKGPGFKLAAYGVKKGGIGGLMATGGMPQLRKVNTGNPMPVSKSKASSTPSIPRLLSSPEIPSSAKNLEKHEKVVPSKSEENISSDITDAKAPVNNPETMSEYDTPLQEKSDQNQSLVIEALSLAEDEPIVSAKSLHDKVALTEPPSNNSVFKEGSDDFSDIIAAVTKVADSYSTSIPKPESTEKTVISAVPVAEDKKDVDISEDGSDSDIMGQNLSVIDRETTFTEAGSTGILASDSSALQENTECQDGKNDDKINYSESELPSVPSESDIIPVPESHQVTSIVEQEAEKESETIQPSPLQARLAMKSDSPLASNSIISGPRGKRPASRKPRVTDSDDKKTQLTQSEALENAIKQDFEETKKAQENTEKAEETNLKSGSIGKINKITMPFAGLTGPPKLPTKPVLARFQNLNSESAENISTQNTNTNQEDQRPRGRLSGARSSFAEQLERSAASNASPAPVSSLQERLKTFVREEIDKVQKKFESQLEVECQARLVLEQEIVALKARLDGFTSNEN